MGGAAVVTVTAVVPVVGADVVVVAAVELGVVAAATGVVSMTSAGSVVGVVAAVTEAPSPLVSTSPRPAETETRTGIVVLNNNRVRFSAARRERHPVDRTWMGRFVQRLPAPRRFDLPGPPGVRNVTARS